MALSIGGGTIADLQSRISMRELEVWRAYRKKFGPMNYVRRFDRGFALVASMISAAHGGKAKMDEFMPWGKVQKEVTLDEIAKAFGKVEYGKRKKRR